MITCRFDGIDAAELAECEPGDRLMLWTKPHLPYINIYRPRTMGGQGMVAVMQCAENPEISALLDQGKTLWFEVERETETRYKFILQQLGDDEELPRKKRALRKPIP